MSATTQLQTKRYAVTLDMYIYAASDKEANESIKAICGTLDQQLDNQPRAKRLIEIPFGGLEAREVKIDKQ